MMMSITGVFFSCFLSWIVLVSSEQSLFHKCDRNGDRQIQKEEFIACFNSDNKIYGDDGFYALFDHLDINQDGVISISEYNKAQETLFKPKNFGSGAEETVTFTDRNGETKEIPLKTVFKAMEDNMKGIKKTKDNKLLKEEEKTVKVSELSKSDPHVDSIVKLGNWAFGRLQDLSLVDEESKLKSVLSDDIKYLDKVTGLDKLLFPKYSSPHSRLVNMTLRVIHHNNKDEFKVCIHYDPIAYDTPYLYIMQAYKIVGSVEIPIDVPAPSMRNWTNVRYSFAKRLFSHFVDNPLYFAILIIFWSIVGAISCNLFCVGDQSNVETGEEVTSVSEKKNL